MKIVILGLCFVLANAPIAHGSDETEFKKCRDENPALAPRYDFPESIRAAKRKFRKIYGKDVPYCPNFYADVTRLTLDSWELIAESDIGSPAYVNIFTEFFDPDNDVVTFNYKVSGGKIIGQGARVTWDVTGLAPGTYTIIAGVNDGAGICGQIKKQKLEILECDTCRLRETE